MKEDHISLVKNRLCSPHIQEEKVKLIKCDTSLSLKIKISNLKAQITRLLKTSTIISISSSNERQF